MNPSSHNSANNSTNRLSIRIAAPEDAEQLLQIYAPYVTDTAISFEYTVPTIEEFRGRIVRTLQKYPYLVAQQDDRIVGYTCAGPFIARAAYGWNVETTIYVQKDRKKTGIGRSLYEALEKALILQNILTANACIGYPEIEDEYLNLNSVQFHEHLGYRPAGTFHHCGFKFNRWYHMVWMEKHLGAHVSAPAPVKPFPEIRDAYCLCDAR